MKPCNSEELAVLHERYRMTMLSGTSPLCIQAISLTDEALLKQYLLKVKDEIEAVNLMVAASIFVKRYSFAVLSPLYAMSVWNKKLDFSMENVSLEILDEQEKLWFPSFKFHDVTMEESFDNNRAAWRDEVLQHIFGHHVNVLFTHIMKTCKLTKIIMWENLYVYIDWMYKELLKDSRLSDIHDRLQDDYEYILKNGPGYLFGSYHRNPFLRYDQSDIEDEEEIRVRKTCCFSYLTVMKGQHCKTCPVTCGRRSPK